MVNGVMNEEDKTPPSPEEFTPIFHMCDEKDFDMKTKESSGLYFSATFDADKFIHATEDPQFLLEAGNHFYKDVPGEWCCLKIDAAKLNCEIVYENPAPVGTIEAVDYKADHELKEEPLFPHIYGGISADSVMERYKISKYSFRFHFSLSKCMFLCDQFYTNSFIFIYNYANKSNNKQLEAMMVLLIV